MYLFRVTDKQEKAVPERDPTTYTWITYAWVLFLAAWGGAVSFLKKVRDGDARASNVMEFVGEIVTSAFAGLITFYLCELAGLDKLLTASLVAVSGHMGTRAIFLLERQFEKYFRDAR